MATPAEVPRRAWLVAIALTTGAALAYQVLLTRTFSTLMAYHFSYLAVSLSLVGSGAGAMLVYLAPGRFSRAPTAELLGRWALRFAWSLVLLPVALAGLDLVGDDPARWPANFAIACAIASLPPFAAGVVVTLALTRFRASTGVVYAADLVGAGVGALLSVPMMHLASPPVLMVWCGIGTAVAGWMFAVRRWRNHALAVGLVGVGIVGAAQVTPILELDTGYDTPPQAFVAERWNPLSRVIGVHVPGAQSFALVLYDRVYAPVPLAADGRSLDWRTLETGVQSVGYVLTGAGRALIIGGGGGRDIHTALLHHQSPVDVIELNDGIRAVVDEDLGFVSGAPYSLPGVHTVIGDGRSTLAARATLYDQIHIGFTDTLSGNAAQGFALMENNLYTLEAFHEYFDHLGPGGVLNVSRLYDFVGEELLRLTVLTQAALSVYGIESPRRHLFAMRGTELGTEMGTVLARLEPFTAFELTRLRLVARQRGARVVYDPDTAVDEWEALGRASDLTEFCNAYVLDVCPPTDDRPFFFNMERVWSPRTRLSWFWGSQSPTAVVMFTLVILGGLSSLALVGPLLIVGGRKPPLRALLYFFMIGLGFILVELVLIQHFVLFLGFPTYALSVVLAGLLTFSGLGSLLSGRIGDGRGLELILVAAIAMIVAGAYGLQPLCRALIGLPLIGRVAVALLVLAPIGLALGCAMPIGLRRLATFRAGDIAYAWGVNGVASVFGSVLGVALALSFGFTVAGLCAALCYLGALLGAGWTKGRAA